MYFPNMTNAYKVPQALSRNKRASDGTREKILETAREVLAQNGKEGLTVARVAQRAGVSRALASQHFQTRQQLIDAAVTGVSDKLCRTVFGDLNRTRDRFAESTNVESVNRRLAEFAMENPALARVWLLEVLSSPRPSSDPFWREYASRVERFAKSEFAQPGIDVQVLAVLTLAGSFLWPVWARAHTRTAEERHQMVERFTQEVLQLFLCGAVRPEKYRELRAPAGKESRRRS